MRDPTDYYQTPEWCAQLGAELAVPTGECGGCVLDPCAGDGALLRAVEPRCAITRGFEIRADLASQSGVRCCDALEVRWPFADAILMNPPFSLWQPFVERAVASESDRVVVLGRLGVLASARRRDWWRSVAKRRGIAVNILSRRPSFTADGKTDAADYAWVVLSRDKRKTGVSWL